MRYSVFLATLWCVSAFAQEGFYASKSEPGHVRRELCVRSTTDRALDATLFVSYCPSVECMNARFDDLSFQDRSTHGVLNYRDKACSVRVVFKKDRAVVTQRGSCGTYGLFAGVYQMRATEVWANDCSPQGPDEHHE